MDPKLNERFRQLSSEFSSSPAARSGSNMPTARDITNEQQLSRSLADLNKQKDANLRDRWYGESKKPDDKKEFEQAPKGAFNNIISALGAPLRGIVGAVDYATGNSRGTNLFDAMNKNANEDRRHFGNTFKDAGLPGFIAKPLGFVTDVVFDPVNILTAGTGGILARMAIGGYKGAAKGGVSGAAKGVRYGAESRALETAMMAKNLSYGGTKAGAKVLDFINPLGWFNKNTKKLSNIESIKNPANAMERRLSTATKKYDEIVGTTAIERAILDRTPHSLIYEKMGEVATKVGEKFPAVKNLYDTYLKYDNESWTRISRIQDALLQHSTQPEMIAGARAFVKNFDETGDIETASRAMSGEMKLTKQELRDAPVLDAADDAFDNASGAIALSKPEVDKFIATLAAVPDVTPQELMSIQKIAENSNEAAKIVDNPKIYLTNDPIENEIRLLRDDLEISSSYADLNNSLKKMIAAEGTAHTGIAWWDNMRLNMTSFKKNIETRKSQSDPTITIKERAGEKAVQAFEFVGFMTGLFKRGAVAGSPRAWTNAILGNVAMASLAGLDVSSPLLHKAASQSYAAIRGKTAPHLLLNELAEVSDLIAMAKANPATFKSTIGLSDSELQKAGELRHLMGRFKQAGVDGGVLTAQASDLQVLDAMEEIMRAAGEAAGSSNNVMYDAASTLYTKTKQSMTGAASRMRKSIDPVTGEASAENLATDLVTNEFFDNPTANKAFLKLAKDKDKNVAMAMGNFLFNTMPEGYSKIDSVFKLTAVTYVTKYGVSESELRQIARNIKLVPEEVEEVVVDGMTRYRFSSSAKAFELANEAFLNYNAMPPIIKLIRQMPLVGAPFISFTYGMYNKVFKGLIRNPAFFSKQSFALEEFSEDKTPVERAILEMERYQYLNDPTMVKLPFPGNQMVYVNAANILPYYSLSLLQPSSRSYEGVLPNNIVKIIDKLPIMKDPLGSLLFDYLLMPALLGSEVPLGSFGQPLYPKDATLGEKAFYMGRSAADPLIPGIVQQAVGTVAPAASADYLPGYLTRKLAAAKEGKTPLGIQAKEDPTSRFGRAFGSGFGVPIQTPVPLEFLDEKEVADKLNQ